MVKRQRTRPASKAEAKQLEIKALQYRKAMKLSFDSGLNDAAVSNAVHAVMLIANAVTARETADAVKRANRFFNWAEQRLP